MLPILVLVGTFAAAWYLLIVKPQRAQDGRHSRVVGQLGIGVHVMTVGGIFGRVESIEGDTVVLEIAPGMQTRVATDGIARIVPDREAAVPATPPVAAQAQQPYVQPGGMQPQPAHPQQQVAVQQHAPAQAQAPAAGFVPAMPQAMPQQQYQPVTVQAPPPQQFAPDGAGQQYMFRAQVGEQPAPPAQGFQPRPWTPPGYQPPAQSMLGYSAPAEAPQPFQLAPVAAPASHQQYAPQQHYAPQQVAGMQQHGAHTIVHPGGVEEHVETPAHQRSKAPEGMGGGAAIEGELAQVFDRARRERNELAEEYRRTVAPLVAHAGADHAEQVTAGVQPVAVMQGVPSTQQLFIGQGQAPQHQLPAGTTFPAPAQVPGYEAVPRPGIGGPIAVPVGSTAEVFDNQQAFQRSAPYAPQSLSGTGA